MFRVGQDLFHFGACAMTVGSIMQWGRNAGVLVLLAACASGQAGTVAAAGTTRAIAVGASGGSKSGVGLEVTAQAIGQEFPLPTPPAPTFVALETAYETLGIALSRRDLAALTIGNDGLKMRRKLGKLELRRLFDCGGTSGMPNAETYTITASIVSTVVPRQGSGSVLTTVVDASAENPSFPGSGVRCSSTGALEEAIVNQVRAQLNGGQ
jgi:hypothetical protein